MATEELKYYSKEYDGSYTLNFPNRNALSEEEIENKFSKFGTVMSIRCTGDERGFRFVRLNTEEAAISAVEGLKYDSEIQLVYRKPKSKEQKSYNNSNNGHHNSNNNDSKKHFKRNFNETSKAHEQRKYNCSDKNSLPTSYNKNNDEQTNTNSYCDQQLSTNTLNEDDLKNKKLDSMNAMRDIIANVFDSKHDKSKEMPESVASVKDNTEEIPPLVPMNKETNKSVKINIAHEIVVGNIPRNYGSAFIIHLLDHYDPISITEISEIQNTGLRFCSVYFMTANDAAAAVEDFDNYNLMGKKLIVTKIN